MSLQLVQGTIHLEAKVVRDLYTILGADCIASARTYSKLMGKKPPDPPDDDPEEEDNQKPFIHLGGDDKEDVIKDEDEENEVKDDDKNKNDDDDRDRDPAAEKDEVKDDEIDERAPGTEVYEGKKGVNYNWFRPQSYDPFPRKGDDMPPAQAYGYDDTDEDNEHDAPLEPVDPAHDNRKFC